MTPKQIANYYAVPVLSGAHPLTDCVQYGEGDFSYNGLRGLGQVGAGAAPPSMLEKALPWALGLGLVAVAWGAWNR